MKTIRAKLTYANLVATLALFLALGGGAVYAAAKIHSNQIAKGAIKNRQLGKKVIKANNIKPNAVTATKIKAGSVTNAKLGKGSLVVAEASGGPVGGVNVDNTAIDLPISGQTSFTPVAGDAYTINLQAQATLPAAASCLVSVIPFINGQPAGTGSELIGVGVIPQVPNGVPVSGSQTAVGLLNPGVVQNISVKVFGSSQCSADAKVDAVGLFVQRAR